MRRAALILLFTCSASADPAVTAERAQEVLFDGKPPAACAAIGDQEARIRCLLAKRFPRSKTVLALYDEMGDVVGRERETDMDGGYRGSIHLVPALLSEEHLRWILAAQRDIAAFVAGMAAHAGAPLRYRHRALVWRGFRSVGKRTPSAYAIGWEVGYNQVGSLNTSATAVRDTVFHELFHLNDFDHDGWSRRVLGPLVGAIVARCDADTACLAPYAPTPTKVRKTGNYYAFQPDNGEMVNEYAAELATRFFWEQRAALRGEVWSGPRFKCGPEENARAWRALADELFGGVDLIPACR